jgi:hypothetical protein
MSSSTATTDASWVNSGCPTFAPAYVGRKGGRSQTIALPCEEVRRLPGKAMEINHYRPSYPDFLSRLVALSKPMRLSLEKAAHPVLSGTA